MFDDLADNIFFILSAYLLAFLPWAVLDASDFIGPEWKSISATWREGIIHLLVVLFPISFILFYIFIQASARDYKEVFASSVALLFSLLHLARTVWGLAQLYELHRWARSSICNLRHMGVYYKPSDGHVLDHPYDLANKMLVSETLVDNQIIHGEARTYIKYGSLSLRVNKHSRSFFLQRMLIVARFVVLCVRLVLDQLRYRSKGIKPPKLRHVPRNPVEIWLRWGSAFAAQGLGEWLEEFSATPQPEFQVPTGTSAVRRHFRKRRDYFAGELLASAGLHMNVMQNKAAQMKRVPTEKSKKIVESTSPFLWHNWPLHSDMRDGRATRNDLFLCATKSGQGLPFSVPHIHALKKHKHWLENGYKPHEFKLNRIIESLPVNFGQTAAKLDSSKLEWLVILLHVGFQAETHHKQDAVRATDTSIRKDTEITDPALENLKDQLGFLHEKNEGCKHEPRDAISLSQLCSFPLTDNSLNLRSNSNRLVLRAGELIDVWMSLTSGEQYDFLLSMDRTWAEKCLCAPQTRPEGMQHLPTSSSSSARFDRGLHTSPTSSSVLSVQKDVEMARLRIQFGRSGHLYNHMEQTITFMGYSMENVRSCLARWVQNKKLVSNDVWEAPISFSSRDPLRSTTLLDISLVCEEFVSQVPDTDSRMYFMQKSVQNRLVGKLQRFLERLVRIEGHGPSSEYLMMLCILSFSALHVHIESTEAKDTIRDPLREYTKSDLAQTKNLDLSSTVMHIRPICGPQNLFIRIWFEKEKSQRFTVLATIGRYEEGSDRDFRWECWRDAFSGRLQAAAEWQDAHGFLPLKVFRTDASIQERVVNWCTGIMGTGKQFHTWLGWPPFRFEFCLYELQTDGFILQYPRRAKLQLDFSSRLDHQASKTTVPGFELKPFSYEHAALEYIMYACSVVRDALSPQGYVDEEETELVYLERKAIRLMHEQSQGTLDSFGVREVHRAVILLEMASVELERMDALKSCLKLLTEHSLIAADIGRAVALLERYLGKLYLTKDRDSVEFQVPKNRIHDMYKELMSTHEYDARVFWSYFKFLDIMLSVDMAVSSESLQAIMRRTFMHTKDYDIVFELGQFPISYMPAISPSGSSSTERRQEGKSSAEIEYAFYQRALREGRSAKAMFELGYMYEHGKGFDRDDLRAASFYQMAIAHGHNSGAKKALGDLYRRGLPILGGRGRNIERAVRMYWRAVTEDQDGSAMYELGKLYQYGEGLSKDPRLAAMLYQGAVAKSNMVQAMKSLAIMYREGYGVRQNHSHSIALIQLAVYVGDDNESRQYLDGLLDHDNYSVHQSRIDHQSTSADATYFVTHAE
ncbi:hypothetical protein BWQ96_00932 [Gracilariopsis chorda]|uniref:Secretory immunoglobulin A-binding protein EsiB n=1 Tax=Gracilariopsis chorda TaxID=448386 RepID=A0A2V3J4K5_9FLOR|nr:hypothetical protein BWQ96_00932 [Gracilariopsis chorda]|eukprot:PXF49358.1 hypothetical protein BWQ96_00932 [Gracilariopsis chorda]